MLSNMEDAEIVDWHLATAPTSPGLYKNTHSGFYELWVSSTKGVLKIVISSHIGLSEKALIDALLTLSDVYSGDLLIDPETTVH